MLYQFKGSNGKIELYENRIVIVRGRFSTFPNGEKEIFIKNLSGIQIKKPGLQAGYIQFIFSGSKEIKSKNIMDHARDENTIMFNSGYENALILKQKIEKLINKSNESKNSQSYIQTASQADELLKFKQLLDSGAITEDEFNIQKNRLLSLSEYDSTTNTKTPMYYEEPKYESQKSTVNNYEKTDNKVKKDAKKTIIICIVAFFISMCVFGASNAPSENTNTTQDQQKTTNVNVSLKDVEKWYNKQIPKITQSLNEYAKSVDGLSTINISNSKFIFGEDSGWFDCHYTIYFDCKVNGVLYKGEARAFLKYNDNDINWFHFEIFDNNGINSIVEHYDEKYDKIIEDHYKELISLYN